MYLLHWIVCDVGSVGDFIYNAFLFLGGVAIIATLRLLLSSFLLRWHLLFIISYNNINL